MNILKYASIAAMSLTMAAAQAAGEPAAQEKPYIFASQSMTITAVVEAIDHDTRVVTLRGPQGNSITFPASEDVRNLAEVDVGDLVNLDYVHDLSIEVYDNPGLVPDAGEVSAVARTEEGEMPGLMAVDASVVTATVEAINIEANTFKLKWPDDTVEEYVARNPDNLKRSAVGDLVVITRTEKLAVLVEEVAQ